MTQPLNVQIPGPKLTTKSGHEVKIGTGSGTKWQKIKKGRDPSKRGDLLPEAIDYLVDAINNGFRHIDTAEIYTTHPEVAAAIAKSDVPREDLFVATKYNPGVEPQPATFDSAAAWVDASLKELGLDYLDSILIHFPFFNPKFSKGQTVELVWKDLIEAKKAGKVRTLVYLTSVWSTLRSCLRLPVEILNSILLSTRSSSIHTCKTRVLAL